MLSSSRPHIPRHAAVPVCGGVTASNGPRQRLRHGPYAIRGAPPALSGEDPGSRGAYAASCRKADEICEARTAPRGRFVRPRGRSRTAAGDVVRCSVLHTRDCGPEQRPGDRSMPGRQRHQVGGGIHRRPRGAPNASRQCHQSPRGTRDRCHQGRRSLTTIPLRQRMSSAVRFACEQPAREFGAVIAGCAAHRRRPPESAGERRRAPESAGERRRTASDR
jgi:hypothetical protein